MKITILALHLGFGGVEKYIATIANILSEKHDVEIISTYQTTTNPSFTLDKKVCVVYLTKGIQPNALEFREAIKHKRVLKVMMEGIKATYILILKKKRNKKAIQMCNSDVIISTRDFHNEMIQKYARKNIVKITSEHNHHCNNQKYIDRLVKSCIGFDYMLPISRELTIFYSKLLPSVDVRHIPFCIDAPTTSLKPTFEQPVYISVGRLSSEKGLLDLIDIFSGILKKQNNAFLHLVGDGDLMPELLKKIEEMHLNKHVKVHGFMNKKDIDILYTQSSLFLMTSYTESFGFVLLEAMACGLPCIAFDSAQGANEIIENGKNGFLIVNRDFDAYITSAISTFENKILLRKLSKNALDCLETFSYENTKQQWLSLMNEVKEKHSIK